MNDGNTDVSCGQRCPDCSEVVHVKGTWDDWDRIHGAVCTPGQMALSLADAPENNPALTA